MGDRLPKRSAENSPGTQPEVVFRLDATGVFTLLYSARPKTAEEWGEHGEKTLIDRPDQIDLCKVPRGKPWVPEGGDTVAILAFVFNTRWVRAECCVDPLRPPG